MTTIGLRTWSPPFIALGAISGAALVALLRFDLGPPLAFVDDWQEAWSVRQLADGHGLHIFPAAAPTALPQIVLGALLTFSHPDQRFLRLTIAPFLVLAAFCAYKIALRAGAGAWWAWVAALSLTASPLVLALSTTFMTDIVFLSLFLAALLFAAQWVESGEGIVLCILLTALATSQRQHGALIPFAVTAGLIAARSRRHVSRGDWRSLAALWAAAALALGTPLVLGLTTLNQGGAGPDAFVSVIVSSPWNPVLAFLYAIPMIGVFMLPLAAGVAGGLGRSDRNRAMLIGAGLAPLLILFGMAEVLAGQIFPGDFLDFFGLGPSTPFNLGGPKPDLFGRIPFAVLGLGSLGSFVVVAIRASAAGRAARLAPITVLLVVAAVAQMVPVAGKGDLDRYFIPVVAPLVPLVARLASSTSRQGVAQRCALAVAVVWVGMYVTGEQDYQAWQEARNTAARQAYVTTNPSEVDAGYEADSVYWLVPYYDRTGRLPDPHSRRPKLVLRFAATGDPAPGQDYSSLAPGRVIIARAPGPAIS